MCGLAGGAVPAGTVAAALTAIAHRGPDGDGITAHGTFTLGHVRLAIQDLTETGAQPVTAGATVVTYNGEMWHPDRLRAAIGPHAWASTGDTEPLALLLDRDGPAALPGLSGMFALAWARDGVLHLARDTYGEIPLHYGWTAAGAFVYASEVTGLLALGATPTSIRWVTPGTYLTVTAELDVTETRWAPTLAGTAGPDPAAPAVLRAHLTRAVTDRTITDRSLAVLLSGGLDSSATAAILTVNGHRNLTAYTAVHDPRSTDLHHARAVAYTLDIPLIEVPVPAPTATDLARIVRTIEMPSKAQTEIAVGCDALGARIAADGHTVILSGEGADELLASYGMAFHGIKAHGWNGYRSRTYTGQHRKNFPRTNKIFMRHGIEARLPFLDPELAAYLLTLDQDTVTQGGKHAKAVLASAVADLLPAGTIWRAKVAFQTGAKLDKAAAAAVADPRAFYAAEYRRAFPGVTP